MKVFSALVCVHHDRTSGEALCCFMPTAMACDELACWPKLLLYLGKIGLIGLELNSEGNNFSFICSAKQQTILLCVPRAWRVLHDHHLSDLEWSFLSVITTCDRSANIHVACSTF